MGMDWAAGKYQAPPQPCADGVHWSWSVMPWDLEVGDRILGTSTVVAGPYSYSEGALGSSAERALFTYPVTGGHGGTVTYSADSPCVSVIRGRAPTA